MIKTLFIKFLFSSIVLFPFNAKAYQAIASVYHVYYHGKQTACGNQYRHWDISAAHRTLPCGTKVKVTYKGRSITVPIRDRCACGDRIDLSGGAARALGIPLNDIKPVTISY